MSKKRESISKQLVALFKMIKKIVTKAYKIRASLEVEKYSLPNRSSIAKGLTGLLIYGSNLFFNPCYAEDNAQSNKNMPPKDKKSYMSQLWGMMREGTRIKFSHGHNGKDHDIKIEKSPEGGHIEVSDNKEGISYSDEGPNGRKDRYELVTFKYRINDGWLIYNTCHMDELPKGKEDSVPALIDSAAKWGIKHLQDQEQKDK
ncbi:MAG: hypothetical protein U5R06_04840 [candidate division KSB1 bacterium]|nr:hypothetical protein [candidate division KSB1 bacterium]